MNVIENTDSGMAHGKVGADIPITPQEKFVNCVYSSLDEAIACGLDQLRSGDGIIPTCTCGCSHCCRNHIVTNVAEAHALAQYIKREFSIGQISSLLIRTKQWHEWNDYRPGSYPSANIREQTDLSSYDHCCPLLVNGTCSAYPVRPVVCRTHFVCSDPQSCRRAVNDPGYTKNPPAKITSVVTAARPFAKAISDHIEATGVDSCRTMMLLPHSLAIEMGWDFAKAR